MTDTPTAQAYLVELTARMGALFVPLSTGWLLLAVVLSVLTPQIFREPHAHTRRKSRRGMLCSLSILSRRFFPTALRRLV